MTEAPNSPAGRTLNVRLLQIGYDESNSLEHRLDSVAELIAQQRGADLIVLPEMWLHGAFASSGWRAGSIALEGPELRRIGDAARDIDAHVLAGTFVEKSTPDSSLGPQGRGLWNTSVLFDRNGSIMATYRKIHRFGFGDGEPSVIEAGNEPVVAQLTDSRGKALCTVGLATCYDLRFPELFRLLVDRGAEIFAIPAAWPLARVSHWTALGVARAIENQAFVVQVNDGGQHGGMQMGGRSQVVDPSGLVLASAESGCTLLEADIDLDEVGRLRSAFPVLSDRRIQLCPVLQAST